MADVRALRSPWSVVVLAALVAYAWWLSGLVAFTTSATVAVAVPVAALLAVALLTPSARAPDDRPRPDTAVAARRLAPWLALVSMAVVLEIVGLALGGRSPAVPTLSTVVDHALVDRFSRFALCCAWLGIGVLAVLRRPRGRRPGRG
jgi:hypothetical protein